MTQVHSLLCFCFVLSDCLDTRKISTEMVCNVHVIIIINDYTHIYNIERIQGMAYANNNNMIFMETSAKTDNNVQEVC